MEVEHPCSGALREIRLPIKVGRPGAAVSGGFEVGADTEAVQAGGGQPQDLDILRAKGVVTARCFRGCTRNEGRHHQRYAPQSTG